MRPHVVAHSSQEANVSHRGPIKVVERSLLQRLQLLELVLARPALKTNNTDDMNKIMCPLLGYYHSAHHYTRGCTLHVKQPYFVQDIFHLHQVSAELMQFALL